MMRGMPYNLHGKGEVEVGDFAKLSSSTEATCKKEGSCASNEPISVLDTRRSPSPSTSTSTFSSSFGGSGGGNGGGGCSTDNMTSLVAVSDNILNPKWPGSVAPETGLGVMTEPDGGGRKDEWAAELQPIGVGNSLRFGLGMEDWESLLSESAASPGQDQSLLRWITGDADDSSFSLKQLLQGAYPNEMDGNAAAGVIDQSSGLEPFAGGGSSGGNVMATLSPSLAISGSGFSLNNNNGKIGSVLVQNSSGLNNSFNPPNPIFSTSTNNLPQIFNPPIMINQPQIQTSTYPNMFSSLLQNTQQEQPQFQPQPKRHNSGISNAISQLPNEVLPRKQQQLPQLQPPHMGLVNQLNLVPPHQIQQKPFIVCKQEAAGGGSSSEQMAVAARHYHHQQQVIFDQLYKAAELIQAGNFAHAQAILARLNHQLSPTAKPFEKAAFYFKEALQMPLLMPNLATTLPPRIPTPIDGMFKMGAYKVLSEVSPIIHFMNFTSNQALLEALDDAERIHIIDFDIGFGAQWASFMQELPRRNNGHPPSLKITAFASPTTHHPVELGLMHENLTQFAHEIGVNFELEVVNFDSFDPNSYLMSPSKSSENEAIAVNFPIWSSSSHLPVLPSLLRFIKQLSPKIIVSMDRGCEQTELPFSQHLLYALQYYEVLLDSVDAANVTSDAANKIERFLFQPRIESMLLGRLHFPGQMPHWRTLFASTGFSPLAFSNIAETQAECVVKKTQSRGFRVEKRQLSLVLCWQGRELMTVSAWRC